MDMQGQLEVDTLAAQLGLILQQRHLRCTVAESCTGGSLAAAITDIPGSSQWFDRGFVTYTNESKQEMLSVSASIIRSDGAVSAAVVQQMAEGAIAASSADVSIAISGIAGPGGGSIEKPVGTVWIAWKIKFQPAQTQRFLLIGDRKEIRKQAVSAALSGMLQRIQKSHQ